MAAEAGTSAGTEAETATDAGVGAEADAGAEAGAEPALPGSEPVAGRRVLCRMCGQPLRDRVSRIWGLGPDCRHKLALRTAPARTGHDEVPQSPLPGM